MTLLNKLISFDCMSINDKDMLKRELYEWFFRWDGKLEEDKNEKGGYKWVKDEKDDQEFDEEAQIEEEKTEEEKHQEKIKAKKE